MKKLFFLSILFFSFLVFADDVTCENEAGNCTLSEDEYSCNCNMLDGLGIARGSVFEDEVTAELCKSYLESNCGKEKPTVRSKCGKKFDFCVTYVSENSRCTDNLMSEDEVIAAVDNEDAWNDTKRAVYYGCCAAYSGAQTTIECLKENCGTDFTDECCAECISDEADTADPGDTDVPDTATDTGDTDEADTADTLDPEDVDTGDADTVDQADTVDAGDAAKADESETTSEDGNDAPTNGATAPAEKEESKSDGCSMLFI